MNTDLSPFESAVKAAVESEIFRRAPKIKKLLEFIAAKTMSLGADKVTANMLVTEFFELAESPRAQKSSVHRVQISRLKSLLADFYAKEGINQHWLLGIPTGAYGLTLTENPLDQSNFSPRLAIIPFQNLGGDSFQGEICIGLAHDLMHLLSQSKTLRIISLTHQFNLSEASRDLVWETAKKSADYVLDGSVRFKPRTYEFLIRLTEVHSSQMMWSRKFELPNDPSQLFEFQNEIALKIAALLASPSGVIDRLVRKKPSDGSAYTAVLHFYAYTEKYTPESHAAAKKALEAAVISSPQYAEAWACLSGVYWNEHAFGYEGSLNTNDLLDESMRCARQALSITPDSVTALYSLATSHYQLGNRALFKEYAQKALDLAPYRSDIVAGLGVFTAWVGDWDEGLALMDRARELMPTHPDWYWCTYYANQYRINNLDKALEYLSKSNVQAFPHSQLFSAAVYHRQGKRGEAMAAFNAMKQIYPDLSENLASYLQRLLPHSEVAELLLNDLKHLCD